jgi:hypothetical protein
LFSSYQNLLDGIDIIGYLFENKAKIRVFFVFTTCSGTYYPLTIFRG